MGATEVIPAAVTWEVTSTLLTAQPAVCLEYEIVNHPALYLQRSHFPQAVRNTSAQPSPEHC